MTTALTEPAVIAALGALVSALAKLVWAFRRKR